MGFWRRKVKMSGRGIKRLGGVRRGRESMLKEERGKNGGGRREKGGETKGVIGVGDENTEQDLEERKGGEGRRRRKDKGKLRVGGKKSRDGRLGHHKDKQELARKDKNKNREPSPEQQQKNRLPPMEF